MKRRNTKSKIPEREELERQLEALQRDIAGYSLSMIS
ncbi:hypothetical protein At1D132_49410 (plasmid) [Agrobacterium fabrum]|nr:hypothetical protein At1D132_49410 [Agrobacterium fabrum]